MHVFGRPSASQRDDMHVPPLLVFTRGTIMLLPTADIGARTFYWQAFTKGVNKPSQAQIGNLGLEVIATQSGGLALNASNDVAGQLQKCIADNGAYYEMSFDSPMSDKPNEYHNLEVRVAKPGLTARTRQGYYSQR